MIRALSLLLLLLPKLALAQAFPALYDVTGVAADDVLNVRGAPTAEAPVLNTLAPDAAAVEVVRLSEDAGWGLVNAGESAGWVSMHYMVRQPGQEGADLPARLFCGGTEPFWAFEIAADETMRFTTPDGAQAFDITQRITGSGYAGDLALVAQGPQGRATAMIARRSCNDGMSDREFGLGLGLLLEGERSEALYTGCCTLQR